MKTKEGHLTDNQIIFLRLIRWATRPEDSDDYGKKQLKAEMDTISDMLANLSEETWQELFDMCIKNNLEGIIFNRLSTDALTSLIPIAIKERLENISKTRVVHEYRKYFALNQIVEGAQERHIKLVIFKGPSLARLYPDYIYRYTSDTDIYVYKQDRQKAVKLLSDLGYVIYEPSSKDQVPVFKHPVFKHTVELHYKLWEDYKGKRIERMKNLNLLDEDKLLEVQVAGMKLTTLGAKEHLIYQMFHIIKHFSIENIGARYLVDITLYVNEYLDQMDHRELWHDLESLGYGTFCRNFFAICVQYLGMTSEILESDGRAPGILASAGGKMPGSRAPDGGKMPGAEAPLDLRILQDMLSGGQIYESKTAAWQLLGIMTPYMVGEERVSKFGFVRKLKVLFPARKFMPAKYKYLKKYPFLLPIGWIHKIIDYQRQYQQIHQSTDDWYNPNEKLATAEYRLNLMKALGLVDKI